MNQEPTTITSLTNPRIKTAVKLRQRSHRDQSGLMLIEGFRELKRALHNNHNPSELFFCKELFQGSNEDQLIQQCLEKNTRLFECSPAVFNKISYRDRPDGLLAVAPQVRKPLDTLTIPDNALLVIAESIEKPGNLGTILRSADAAGAHAVLVCDRCTDINNPNVVRASIGTLFALPVIETSTDQALQWLKQHNVRTVAATPHATQPYTAADMTPPTAIVLGPEQYGLSNTWLDNASEKVRIPMSGQADSLNVAAAATILLFEAVRQRHETQPETVSE